MLATTDNTDSSSSNEGLSFNLGTEKEVVYMVDNPLFRGFWENGNFLFGNAVFLLRD